MRTGLLVLLVVLGSCKKDPKDSAPTTPEACPPDSLVTWNTFGEGWFDTWCTGCHSAMVSGEDRNGAPEGLDFDTWEQVVALAPRIETAATGDTAFMPPQGGISEAERALLEEWIACGLPGDPDPTEVCGMSAAVITDDVVLAGQTEADILCASGSVRLAGTLEITGSVAADCVCGVEGVVTVSGNLSATNLESSGGLRVDGGHVDLPLLSLIGVSGLRVEGVTEAAVALPMLTTVAGDAAFLDNPGLVDLALPRLSTVAAGLRFERNPVLSDLDDTEALLSVGGDLVVWDNDALVELTVARFATDLGQVRIEGNDALTRIDACERAEAAGVFVMANPTLQQIQGFDSTTDLDRLFVTDNALLTQLGGFGSLTEVAVELQIVDNPVLPSAEVDGLLNRITVSGASTVSGNGP